MAMSDSYAGPAGHPTDRLVGTTPAMATLRAQIRHLAPFDTPGSPVVPTLLLQGKTGTGKGLVARIIHDSGPRAAGPFIEVNCAAIPETMLEAELFGFEPGAFTDAKRVKPGLFEAASGGTLLLDEVDALPLILQGKLLMAIEAKWVRRSGALMERAVDVKLMAATNAALPENVATGQFRADLYHRLAVVVLVLPPLRERGADICGLAKVFLQHYTAAHGIPSKRLSAEAEAWLQGYGWPGNVRELSYVMERVTLLHMGEEVDAATLMQLGRPLSALQVSAKTAPAPQDAAAEQTLPAAAEQTRQALLQTGGGEKALAGSAHREAVGYFEQALSALPHLPETRDACEQAIDLRLALRSALFPSGDSGRILAALREAEAFAAALDDPRRLGQDSIFLSNISTAGARTTRPSLSPSAPSPSPRPVGMSSCTRWRTFTLAYRISSRATIVGRSTALGRPWHPSTGSGAASASANFSCQPWSHVPGSACAMPSWARSSRAGPLAKKGSGSPRRLRTPAAL
jgi:transcriptional regulator with AAA-type ATPase domain